MNKFQTIAKVRAFLRSHGVEFKGIYEVYTLTDGRKVKFIDRSTRNTWGIPTEAT